MAEQIDLDPTIFTDHLPSKMQAVIPEVAATIDDKEIDKHSISALRMSAEDSLLGGGITNYSSIDLSRVALAARLHKIIENRSN